MRATSTLTSVAAFTTALTLSLTAFAAPEGAECEVDTDCDGDLICEVTGGYGGCTAPACAPGEECPEPVCESFEVRSCVRPPCQSDADCGAGLRCVSDTVELCTPCAVPPEGEPMSPDCGDCTTETYTECVPKLCTDDADCEDPNLVCIPNTWESCSQDDVACAPGEDCIVPEPVCETESVSYCGPKYLGPCEVAADCGEGFDCVAEESCGCSGSGGSSSSDGSAEPPPNPSEPAPDPSEDPSTEPVPPETCSCESTGRNYCQPQEIECPTGDECPTDWECTAVLQPAIDCAPDTDCPEPEPAPNVCLPPMWNTYGTWGESQSADDSGTSGGERDTLDLLEAPAADPADQSDADARVNGSSSNDSGDSGGCSVSGPGGSAPSAFALFALLGLVIAGRRRR